MHWFRWGVEKGGVARATTPPNQIVFTYIYIAKIKGLVYNKLKFIIYLAHKYVNCYYYKLLYYIILYLYTYTYIVFVDITIIVKY